MTAKRATAPQPKKDTKTGLWWWVFDSAHPRPDGSRRQVKRRGFPTRKAANEALQKALAEDRPAGDDLTVGQVLDRFVASKVAAGRAPNTVSQYRWAAGLAKSRWDGWPAETLTGDQLDIAYGEWLAGGKRKARRGKATEVTDEPMSARSVEIVHKAIKAAYALELRRRDTPLRWNPADDATCPTVGEQTHTWWTPDQVAAFLAYDADPEHDDLPTGTVEMLCDTGGRRGEVVAIRWSDLDLDAGTASVTRQFVVNNDTNEVEVRPTKRPRSKSVISLHPATVVALKRRKAEQAADRLVMGAGWPGEQDIAHDLALTLTDGRMLRPDTLTRIIARMSVAAGLPRLTPHGLRHSFATAALKARVPVEVVAARLGNTPRVVQEIYAHVIPADDAAAAQTVGDLFRPKASGS